MDKRSWPWKKKSLDKFIPSNEGFESSSSRDPDDQDAVFVLQENGSFPDEQQKHVSQECERKLKDLTDKLSAALLDAASKDALVKQHAKVAEEAISGWEKAEAETASLREQLDSVAQHKLAVEDRVVHLDAALKECMIQLRHTREQQEENIHDAIVKKTRDWDRERAELEERLADLEQQFLEGDAENKALKQALQERGNTISQLNETCSKAEAGLNMLRIQLESSEKERNAFKYELNIMRKELEIRNEEKVLSERAGDAATKQHLEDVKVISKLDAECQRLRGLVRKKLPSSPGALAQMRVEINGINKDNKRKTTKIAGSPRAITVEAVENDHRTEDSVWLERYSALEEETKMLRESLTKKNSELHYSSVMCARTAAKLSSVEQQLDMLTNNLGMPKLPIQSNPDMLVESTRSLSNSKELSLASASEDGNDGEASCAESWASALILELDQFKKGKPTRIPSKMEDSSKSELDDFMEMEHFAAMSSISTEYIPEIKDWEQKGGAGRRKSINISSPVSDQSLKTELKEACWRYEEVNAKLLATEEELVAWKSENAANQETLSILKRRFEMLFEAQEASANIGDVLDKVREEMGMPSRSIVTLQKQIKLLSKSSGHDDEASCEICGDSQKFISAVFEIIQLVEEVNTAECQYSISSHEEVKANFGSFDRIALGETFYVRFQKLVSVKNDFLHEKANLGELMEELVSVLSFVLKPTKEEGNGHTKSLSWSRSVHVNGHRETPEAESPKSYPSEGEDNFPSEKRNPFLSLDIEKLEMELKKALLEKSALEEEIQMFQSQKVVSEEELRKAISEKVALQTHMRAEFTRLSSLEQELVNLKTEGAEKDRELAETKERFDALNTQLKKAEQQIKNLTAQLSSVELAKKQGEEELRRTTMLKEQLDSQLSRSRAELSKLQEKAENASKDILTEQKKYLSLEAKCNRLQEKHNFICPRCAMANEESEQIDKEQEVAAATEKLAECQRTILVVGQQLKALASPRQSNQQSRLLFDQINSERYGIRSNTVAFADDKNEAVDNFKEELYLRTKTRRDRKESWNPHDSIASDVLDSELISLSTQGQTTGKKVFGIFGDKIPAHEDYIEAVEQMPSSPEVEPASPKKHVLKPSHRKKRSSPRSYSGIDLSKSMNDVSSPSERHGSGFARFFSRSKNSN